MSAYLLQPLRQHGFFLLKICEEFFDKLCRPKMDAAETSLGQST